MNRKLILFFSLFFTPLYQVVAHPHMFVNAKMEANFIDEKLDGVWLIYTFDSFFSMDILWYNDINQDGIFDNKETKDIQDEIFTNFKPYGYFINIRTDKGRTSPHSVSKFSVWEDNKIINFRFYIDLKQYNTSKIAISITDPTFFCSCLYTKEDISLGGDIPPSVKIKFEKNSHYPIYYDPFAPLNDMRTYDKWVPGLETVYPKEFILEY